MNILQNKINILLTGGIVVLAALCISSIVVPIAFLRERQAREKLVKERLVVIRQAEEDYRARHGAYCVDIDSLVKEMRLPPEVRFIPGTPGKKWKILTSVVPGSNGKTMQLMETGAPYDDYLQGLDRHEIERITDIANQGNRYPGLKIGNIVTPNNNAGNWE